MAGIKVSELPVASGPLASGDRIPFVDASDADLATRLKTRPYDSLVGDVATSVEASLTSSIVAPAEAAAAQAEAAALLAVQGTNPKGEWSAGAAYAVNDLVHYNGWAWACVTPHTNSAPTAVNTKWKEVYRDGADGADGAEGPKGDKGDPGDTGPEGPKGDEPAHEWSGTSLRLQNPDGTWGPLVNLRGLDGDGSGDVVWADIDQDGDSVIDLAERANAVDWAGIENKPATFVPAPHEHDWTEITGTPTQFAPVVHTHVWADITDAPEGFELTEHTHLWAEITDKPVLFAPSAHAHSWTEITDKPSVFAPSTHTHVASEIASGTLDANRLPTVPVTKGGTGSTTAAGARTNLGLGTMATRAVYVQETAPSNPPVGAIWLQPLP